MSTTRTVQIKNFPESTTPSSEWMLPLYSPSEDKHYSADAGAITNQISVLSFAGATNEEKLANALASGQTSLLIPAGTEIVLTSTKTVPAGVTLRGQGKTSKISTTGSANPMLLVGGDDVIIEDIWFALNTASFVEAIKASVSRVGTTIRRCFFTGHKASAINLLDSVRALIEGNTFLLSGVVLPANHTQAFYDIFMSGAVEGARVTNNYIDSGQGVGIGFQTILGTTVTVRNNRISNNTIRNSIGYGIMLYSLNADSYFNNSIVGNSLYNITGQLTHSTDGAVYGAGIYNQNCPNTLIAYNHVDTCCVNTAIEQLSPGGIGTTGRSAVQIVGNYIRNSAKWGIYCQDAVGGGNPDYTLLIKGNVTTECAAGLKCNSSDRALIAGNVFSLNTGIGAFITDAVGKGNFIFSNNYCYKNGSHGAQFNRAILAQIHSNVFDGNGAQGIALTGTGTYSLWDNDARNNTAFGFSLGAGVTVQRLEGSLTSGNTSGSYSIDSAIVFPGAPANQGDAALVLTLNGADTYTFNTTLTANRNVTFSSTPPKGKEFTILRTAAGAFDVTINTSLATLAQNQWITCKYDGAAWFVKARGSLV